LRDHLYRCRKLTVWRCAALKQTSLPGENEADFRVRLSHGANEQRDVAIEKLRVKYAPKFASVQEQIRKAEQRVEREKSQSNQSALSAALSVGQSLLGALLGRKVASVGNISRAGTAARAAGRAAKERGDIGMAQESVEALQTRLADLETEFAAEAEKIKAAASAEALALEAVEIQPKKADIDVTRVTLAWQPWLVAADGRARPAT
jgi:hypothetical protein